YGIDRDTGRLVCGSIVFDLAELRVADDAFLLDIALASAAAVAGGAAPGAVEDVARSFEPGAHRRQVIATIGGVTYVNDSKATNPHAALAAIRSYPSVILIAGGQAKGLDIGPLAVEPNVKSVVAIGESADVLLANAGPRGSKASSMEEAVRMATEAAAPGDVVLLAPACASFDMFDDYKHRGEVFSAIVTREGGAL
ncbi:MAG: UDP-N-acetylmuramoyl-L-alanine--D-glutamate ligase, partial [Acidimicrobiia bacterium]|nr:UDP-N-acetylmuramoyl-L-alanine--D-glutamate ligase [Acidimicrobiia bacterium]